MEKERGRVIERLERRKGNGREKMKTTGFYLQLKCFGRKLENVAQKPLIKMHSEPFESESVCQISHDSSLNLIHI